MFSQNVDVFEAFRTMTDTRQEERVFFQQNCNAKLVFLSAYTLYITFKQT